MLVVLLVVDLVILITWQVLDPLQRDIELFPLEDPASADDDVKIRPELEHCRSHHHNVWMGTCFYKFITKNIHRISNNQIM